MDRQQRTIMSQELRFLRVIGWFYVYEAGIDMILTGHAFGNYRQPGLVLVTSIIVFVWLIFTSPIVKKYLG